MEVRCKLTELRLMILVCGKLYSVIIRIGVSRELIILIYNVK